MYILALSPSARGDKPIHRATRPLTTVHSTLPIFSKRAKSLPYLTIPDNTNLLNEHAEQARSPASMRRRLWSSSALELQKEQHFFGGAGEQAMPCHSNRRLEAPFDNSSSIELFAHTADRKRTDLIDVLSIFILLPCQRAAC
jgi:hypothetical protein